jgi:hypothetical protein
MDATWFDHLSPDEEEKTIRKVADEVRKRGLEVPAVFALESHKPVGGMVANLSVVGSPFLVPLFGFDNVQNFGRLLTNRESIERLIRAIEYGPDAVFGSGHGNGAEAEEPI